ncbi:MAG: TetR/AcrR family transcriptional regulator [Pseudomonadales bacterium]|nr:TetR/AcrR family transcriptional regulator [Pseudomonadales bacterium]
MPHSATPTKRPNAYSNILQKATPMFAAQGYSGVSMRDISKKVGTSAAALYHHFPNKQRLYLAVMEHVFADKVENIVNSLDRTSPPQNQLTQFVSHFVALMGNDLSLRTLLQRELLDGDEARLKLLTERLFVGPFEAIASFAKNLSSKSDPYMLAISMVGLIIFHFETAPIREYLSDSDRPENDFELISNHVTQLLSSALGANQ